ncbi:MAG: diguanylate cyclase [Candidatus Aminicenantes bacterium]|nr:diguanylate cyclase [Candidatus Aminicenantes bacterium]NIM84979.1 diguanylate cyclase [Candidatus Aminicenantes bacterium]NIN24493.1 diguanylate cyclase [Candidatus Aminicenantes bacterium]NIN48257.1 diguanylate cyclase [Candidatus Aminicenantes bacterium]NIN91160.1 diguanylate cyclase [Candidatus Aminicenantes bacterium]
MKDRERKTSDAARVYRREFQLLERIRDIQNNSTISKDQLLKEYSDIGKEYSKLLKQTIKITRIGDSNQKKLLLANEQIEKQKEELRLAYQKMERLARTDPLTKLSNRRDFLERFRHEVNRFERSRKSFSVVLGDIDDFKVLNDQYGHDCGDFILINISSLMRAMIRKQDFVARWGGEEFIFLLPESSLEGGQKVAEAIRKKISAESFSFNGQRISITLTLGVCEFNGTMGIDTCIKKADEALYRGKERGKNCVVLAEC